jgi:carbonic anhydrase
MRHKALQSTPLVLLGAALLLGASCGKPAEQPPADAPRVTTQTVAPPAEAPHWNYGEAGPAVWATLSPSFAACAAGKSQSPIDIVPPSPSEVPAAAMSYGRAALRIVHHEHMADGINNGHTVQINYGGADTLVVGDERFVLLQYHFHAPSEHTISGRHAPMEMHLVHKSAAGNLAVLGVLIEEGAANAAFAPVWANLPTAKGMETHYQDVEVDVDDLLPANRAAYRYSGSLTTPPCSEGVRWFVLATPIQLSAEQVAAFKAVVQGNNRPVQPLNDRPVVLDKMQ